MSDLTEVTTKLSDLRKTQRCTVCGHNPLSEYCDPDCRSLHTLRHGQRIEWCGKHEASFFGMDRCGRYLFEEPIYDGDPDPGECVMESRLVVEVKE